MHLVTRAMAEAMRKAVAAYRATCQETVPPYDVVYWHMIFCFFFGEIPENDEDPRWDLLLFDRKGFGGLSVEENLRTQGLL